MFSQSEENYIKAIYHLSSGNNSTVSTNAIAESVHSKAASVTDMIKKLKTKKLVSYEKYQGVTLTKRGEQIAKQLVRHHRLWEVFLHTKLGFAWDEIHDIAEQLEHIKSDALVERLDKFLGYPKYDPHGDPIPDGMGNIQQIPHQPLTAFTVGAQGKVMGVKNSSVKFLQYLDSVPISLGSDIEVVDIIEFDQSYIVRLNRKIKATLSYTVAQNILVE